jgi:KAP family P-loop domain
MDRAPPASPDSADPFGEQLLAALLTHRHGHKPSGEAFVVSVFGEWGVGKTHCLRSVEERLNQRLATQLAELAARADPTAPTELVVPVTFDAWRHERDEHLVVPLLKTLEQHLLRLAAGEDQRLSASTNDFIARNALLGQHLLNAGRALGLVATALIGTVSGKLNFGFAEAQWSGKDAIALWRELRATKPAAAPKPGWWSRWGRSDPPASPDAKALLQETSLALGGLERLAKLTAVDSKQPVRLSLVVLVDDLDRCLPEKAIQVLESIKLFLNVPGYSFVLAVDDEVVERGIAYRYRDYRGEGEHELPISGAQYLEKIVHLPLTVPRWTVERAQRFLRQRYPDLYGDNPEQQAALSRVLAAVPLVPRKLIRLSEALQFERQRFEKAGAQAHWRLLHMLRVVALQQLYPALNRCVREHPTRYWLLANLKRDPVWEGLEHPDPRIGATTGSVVRLRELQAGKEPPVASASAATEQASQTTLREVQRLLEAVDQAARQRGAADPVSLFEARAGETLPSAEQLFDAYPQPRAVFHALYFRGEPPPPAPAKSAARSGHEPAVAAVADVEATVQALVQPNPDFRAEAIERLQLRGRQLPGPVFERLLDAALAQPQASLLDLPWLRDIASLLSDAQLEQLYQRGQVLTRWAEAARGNEERK